MCKKTKKKHTSNFKIVSVAQSFETHVKFKVQKYQNYNHLLLIFVCFVFLCCFCAYTEKMLEIDDELKQFVSSDRISNDKDTLYGFLIDIIDDGVEKMKQFNNDMIEAIEAHQRRQDKKSRRLQNISLMKAHLGQENNSTSNNNSRRRHDKKNQNAESNNVALGLPKPPNQGVNLLEGNVNTKEMNNLMKMADQNTSEIPTVTQINTNISKHSNRSK